MSLGFLASKKEFTTTFNTTFSTSSSFTTTFSTSNSTTTTFSTSQSTTTTFNTSQSTTTTFSTSNTTSRSTAGALVTTNSAQYYWLQYGGGLTGQVISWGMDPSGSGGLYYPSGHSQGYIGTTSLQNTYYSNVDGYTYNRLNTLNTYGSCCGGINYHYYDVARQGNTNTSYTTNFNTSRSTTTTFSTSKSTTTTFNTTRSTTTTFNTTRSTTTTFNTTNSTSRTTSFYA